MPRRVKCNRGCTAPITGPVAAKKVFGISGHTGIGMLEFLVALLIFSMGMMGLLTAQLAGKKAGHEAAQRSIATALVRDMLERIRANPGQIADYRGTEAGDASHRLPLPDADCDTTACSASQLATFDVWQWESLLLGESEKLAGIYAGGLVSPRACITGDTGEIAVTISWLGATNFPEATVAHCAGDDLGIDSASAAIDPTTLRRQQLTISTFIEPL
jgi:type IV pilus assembly protein PilV